MNDSITIKIIYGIPEIFEGDPIDQAIYNSIKKSDYKINDGDIFCIAQKIISKSEGCIVDLNQIKPSDKAIDYSEKLNKDPRKIQVILNQSKSVIRSFKHEGSNEGVIICEHKLGFISANAGVDESNIEGDDKVITLPSNPDESANNLRKKLESLFGARLGVIITDTFGRPWRIGQVNVAIGLSGVPATLKEQGNIDNHGRRLMVTEPAYADEIAAASGLMMKKSKKTPVILFQGLHWTSENSVASELLR
ncbi:MAG: Coenzyme F420:L-glutamate ligase, partial [Alphaproteobacteria bacterium MarineAlpha2_Bin1]